MAISKLVLGLFVCAWPVVALAQSAIQYQRGDDNQVALRQSDGVGSVSQQYQQGTGNLARTTQAGDYNDAHVRQRASFSEAQVSQDGQYNQLRIYRGGSDWVVKEGGSAWIAEVIQLGNANQVVVTQDQGFGSGAYLRQEGDRNVHQIRQDGYPNRLEATSIGDDNRVTVNQIDGFGTSRVSQLGNANQVSIEQWVFPYKGIIEVAQSGHANQAFVIQRASRFIERGVVLYQAGDSNRMSVMQSHGANGFSFAQHGNENQLNGWQAGPALFVDGHTTGNRNRVDITQVMHHADLRIDQLGDDNSIETVQYDLHTKAAEIDQIGSFNHAVLSQTSGFTSNQLATIVQRGNGNLAGVRQQ